MSADANSSMSSVLVADRPAWAMNGADCSDDDADPGPAAPVAEATAAHAAEAAPVLLALLDKKARGGVAGAQPATSAPPAPAPAAPVIASWEIRSGDRTLNAALARWAANAGWQLLWEVPVDYAVEADTSIPGTFEQAVEVVTRSMGTAEIPLKAIFYKGNHVLRIVVKGAE